MDVVAGNRRAVCDFFDYLLAVNGKFERGAHVDVVKRRGIAKHRHGECRTAGHVIYLNVLFASQEMQSFQFELRNGIHITGDQGDLTGVGIVEHNEFDFVEVGTFEVPAVMAHQLRVHAGAVTDNFVGTRAVSGLPVNGAVGIGRQHGQMVVGHQPRQVCVAAGELEGYGVGVVFYDFLDILEQRRRGRSALFAAMVIQRSDSVIRGKGFATMERGVSVQFESPLGGIDRCRP